MNSLVMTEGFSQTSNQLQQAEIAAISMAARAKSQVEARYIMALRNPRNWDQARQDILKECNRSSFAENKSVWYKKPIGKGVEGLGIRFVEMAFRCMKNIDIQIQMVFEDQSKEIYEVCVTDLEVNVPYNMTVPIAKTIERSKPMDDGSYLSVRKNSFGGNTYTLPARDDEILDKRNALISKAIRSLGLKHIPGDIKDEAEAAIKLTRLNSVNQDPDMHRKKIVDAFSKIGVKAIAIVEYLGHPLDQCSPEQIEELRTIYSTIGDGESTWKQYVDKKNEDEGKEVNKIDPLQAASSKQKKGEVIDHKTGVIENKQQTASMSYAQVNDILIKAKTKDELEMAGSFIDQVEDESLRIELVGVYDKRFSEIK